MSGMVRGPAPASAGAAGPAAAPASGRVSAQPVAAGTEGGGARREPALRLAAFAALGLFAAGHWASLVEAPSTARTLLVVVVATGGASVLALLGTPRVRRSLSSQPEDDERSVSALIVILALLAGLATIVLGLVAAGLPVRLLGPGNWPELFDGLDRGLAGMQTVEWPYGGPDEWVRLSILLGPPCLLGIAATLAFFPARRAAPGLRMAGLVMLLLLYGMPVTEHDPGEPLLRGLVLLALVAAWLWLPRLSPREAAAGAALVLSLGVVSLPVAAALDGDERWWDYGAVGWFGAHKVVSFDWTHRYGPLDWPREGTTLLNVKSSAAHYWKAETLDSFDGLRWVRGRGSDATQALQGLPEGGGSTADGWDYFEWNPKWDVDIRFTVRALSSDLLIAAGMPYRIEGAGLPVTTGDGTVHSAEPLTEGESYTVHAYAPDPTPNQMRGAPGRLPSEMLRYTSIAVPQAGESALDRTSGSSRVKPQLLVPLWGSKGFADPEAPRRELERSAYSRMYRVATDLTAGTGTMYDAVRQVERYLDQNLTYSEKTPRARFPLNAFLFRDKIGYCQQFSGAMALMLRMVGIPTRVAAGFAPGSLNRDTGEYRVRDLDAHSWVEVYFNGIGWVTFDPTPAASPAEAQAADLAPTSTSGGAINGSGAGTAGPDRSGDAGSAPVAGSDNGPSPWLLLPLLPLAGLALMGLHLARRSRRLSPVELADAQLVELRRALSRLGWDVPAATTLTGLERRLGRAAGPAAARYAAALRAHRYAARSTAAPSRRERRSLRRELTSGTGLLGRLRGLLAIPPGGPRPV
jgi:protein-glutamine gamma-glutamyltransferase